MSRQTVHAAIRGSRLHGIRVGRDWTVLHSSVDEYRLNQLYAVGSALAPQTTASDNYDELAPADTKH